MVGESSPKDEVLVGESPRKMNCWLENHQAISAGGESPPKDDVLFGGSPPKMNCRLENHHQAISGGCIPEWPTGDACVVFGDNKVWPTCWNGG